MTCDNNISVSFSLSPSAVPWIIRGNLQTPPHWAPDTARCATAGPTSCGAATVHTCFEGQRFAEASPRSRADVIFGIVWVHRARYLVWSSLGSVFTLRSKSTEGYQTNLRLLWLAYKGTQIKSTLLALSIVCCGIEGT